MVADDGARQLRFRPFRPEDVDGILELFLTAFGNRWPNLPLRVSPRDHLEWKLSSPDAQREQVHVLEINGRISLFGTKVLRTVWVKGRNLPWKTRGDVAVHPDLQGRGLTRVGRDHVESTKSEGVAPISVRPASTHARLQRSQELRGERVAVANQVRWLVRQLSFSDPWARAVREGTPRAFARAARASVRFAASGARSRPAPEAAAGLTFREVERFDRRLDELWERARTEFDFALVRDSRALNWRYCDPRAGVYRVRAAERDGELAGVAVVAPNRGDAQIVDLLATPHEAGVVRALLEDALEVARHEGATALSMALPTVHPYGETARRMGFVPGNLLAGLGYERRDDDVLEFLARDPAARLHFTLGDTDTI